MNIVAAIGGIFCTTVLPLVNTFCVFQFRAYDGKHPPTKGFEKKIFDFYQKIAPPRTLCRSRIQFALTTCSIPVILTALLVYTTCICMLNPIIFSVGQWAVLLGAELLSLVIYSVFAKSIPKNWLKNDIQKEHTRIHKENEWIKMVKLRRIAYKVTNGISLIPKDFVGI